ncbi:MAG TPA: type VI secretion system protein TssA [Burkholderiaceae bacterium]
MLDLDALLRPIDDAEPAGPDLEYSDVAELDRFAAGTPGTIDPKTQELVGAEEPNWRKVAEMSKDLLGKTKDLRVAVWLARAELANRGLPGLADGLKLIARLCEDFWETLYPVLDRDYDNDPMERMNALANLSPDPAQSYGSPQAEGMLRLIRGTAIVESREVGRYTVRDLEYVLGRMQPPEGQTAPQEGLLVAAWQHGDPEANQEKRDGIQVGLAAIQAIDRLFNDHSGQRPGLDLLQQTFKRVGDFYAAHEVDDGSGAGDAVAAEGGDDGDAGGDGAGAGKSPRSGGLASRADAVRILQQVAEFLRKAEPSSPAPMFVDRAIKLLQMDFNAIVRELMPDSKDRIEMLGGISLDDPESDDD